MPERPGFAAHEPADDGGEQARAHALGAALVTRLHAVLRGLRLYDPGHRGVLAHQQELLDAVRALAADEVSLLGMGEYFYVNGARLRPDSAQVSIFRGVLDELEVRHLGGLRFAPGLALEELQSFLRVFHAERTEQAAAALEAACARAGIRNVGPIRLREAAATTTVEPDADGADSARHRSRVVFERAVTGTRELLKRTARTGRPALQQARRVVQPIVDQLLKQETSLVGLTALKQHDEYTYAHCVNVSILSIRMGQVLGLSRAQLANIGVAALLHDTGKIKVPAEVLRKPGQLDPAEWAAVRRHPIEGLRIVSHLPGLSELMIDSMRVAFEHHMHVDHTGYPRVARPRELAPYSRIVAVADIFDAVTSHRAYRKRPMTAHEALRLLVGRERPHFERAVLWALVQTVGLYPAGSLLEAASGRLLLSVTPSSGNLRRPMCRELRAGPDGTIIRAPDVADAPLAEDDHVKRVIPPEELAADVETLLAA